MRKQSGYVETGSRKLDLARNAAQMDPARNRSRSFQVFTAAIEAACGRT